MLIIIIIGFGFLAILLFTINYKTFVDGIDRVLIEDFMPIYSNKHKFRIIYTDNDTYLSKDPNFEPEEKEESLFTW